MQASSHPGLLARSLNFKHLPRRPRGKEKYLIVVFLTKESDTLDTLENRKSKEIGLGVSTILLPPAWLRFTTTTSHRNRKRQLQKNISRLRTSNKTL